MQPNETYIVKQVHGVYVITDDQGNDLNCLHAHPVVWGLFETFDLMLKEGISQSEILDRVTKKLLRNMIASATWVFPQNETQSLKYTYHSQSDKRKAIRLHPGIYFVMPSNNKTVIKVGRSTDFYDRSKALFHDLGKAPVRLLAFAEIDNHWGFEDVLHDYFKKYRVSGEFFNAGAVTDFINTLPKLLEELRREQ